MQRIELEKASTFYFVTIEIEVIILNWLSLIDAARAPEML